MLELRQRFAVVVRLGPPHAKHGRRADLPEMTDEPDVVLEMAIQDCPLKGEQPFHGDEFHLPPAGPLRLG
jgi:hypothetical protein